MQKSKLQEYMRLSKSDKHSPNTTWKSHIFLFVTYKDKYEVLSDGSYELIEEGSRGKDIVLTIDIELQKAVKEILSLKDTSIEAKSISHPISSGVT